MDIAERRDDLASLMAEKIERNRSLGYKFAMLYVTPEEKSAAMEARTFDALAIDEMRILPSIGSDEVKKARGDADHEFFMAIWGDMFGLEAMRAKAALAVLEAANKPAKKAKVPAKPKAEGAPAKPAKRPAKKKAKAKRKPAKATAPGTTTLQ